MLLSSVLPGVSTVCNLASVKDSAPWGWSQLLLGKSLLKAYLEGLWSSVTNDMQVVAEARSNSEVTMTLVPSSPHEINETVE